MPAHSPCNSESFAGRDIIDSCPDCGHVLAVHARSQICGVCSIISQYDVDIADVHRENASLRDEVERLATGYVRLHANLDRLESHIVNLNSTVIDLLRKTPDAPTS